MSYTLSAEYLIRTEAASPTMWKRESAAGLTRCGYKERNWPGPKKAKAPEL